MKRSKRVVHRSTVSVVLALGALVGVAYFLWQYYQSSQLTLPTATMSCGMGVNSRATASELKEAVEDGNVADLTTAEQFNAAVSQSMPIVIKFYAPWCGACRAYERQFKRAAKKFENTVGFYSVNTETLADASSKYGIEALPTTIVLSGGSEVARQVGSLPQDRLVDFVNDAISAS